METGSGTTHPLEYFEEMITSVLSRQIDLLT